MKKLTLFDATCLIVGIIIGAGIYEIPSTVAQAVRHPWELYLLWIGGGFISLCGAMCYAELATTYPESGGDVVYLSRAYGRWAGFLFGWLHTFVARPGDTSLMALVFARYLQVLTNPAASGDPPVWPAIACVIVLTMINIVGLQYGKTTQNFLTVVKVIGLLLIVGLALASPTDSTAIVTESNPTLNWGVAMIFVLFTYGGWNDAVYVASEVHEPKRNIWRALLFGTIAITLLYLLTNVAYLQALTIPGMAASNAIATDAISGVLPRGGQMFVAGVIMISAAGAMNGLILTGGRITGALAQYPAFRWLQSSPQWNHVPVKALLLECAITICVILAARTFNNALIYTASAVYTFYLATCVSTAVMRWRDPKAERLFRVPGYPIPLIVFGASCVFMIYSAVEYRRWAAVTCLAILALGGLVYLIQSRFELGNEFVPPEK